MKTTILSLVLASIAGLMYCSDESLAVTQEPEDTELQALQKARRDALKEYVQIIEAQGHYPGVRFAALSKANISLFEAEFQLAKSQQERISILEKALEAQTKLENIARLLVEHGTGRPEDLSTAKAARMKAEIDLHQAKKGKWPVAENFEGETPAAVQEPEGRELCELLEARSKTLREGMEIANISVSVGRATHGDLARAVIAVLDAELELAKSQEERISILEEMLEGHAEIEQVEKAQRKIGIGSELDFLIAKAAREKAAINVYKARKGKWPLSVVRGDENAPVTQEPEDRELRTLMVEHRDTLKKIVSIVDSKSRKGAARLVDVVATNEAFFEAELELAKSQDERIAVFEKMLEAQTVIKQEVKRGVDVGVVPKTELLIVTAARLKAEIDLHKARKKPK